MMSYFAARIRRFIALHTVAEWWPLLNAEFGGMNDAAWLWLANATSGAAADDGRMMIECEGCGAWAHTGCLTAQMAAEPGAFAYSFQASWHRLTGQRPNESECYYAGVPFEKVN